MYIQAPVGPQADPSVFTHLSQADRDDPHLWTHMCYGEILYVFICWAQPTDSSVVERSVQSVECRVFESQLIFLRKGDCLVRMCCVALP